MATEHLASLGAREIPRTEFSQRVAELVNYGDPPGCWRERET
jgi:leucyl/phenylalanyl-tRNA--protein transferase